MNTKRQYFDEAERLYVIEQYSLIEIARKLNCSLVKAKIISKFAHKHFFEELKILLKIKKN